MDRITDVTAGIDPSAQVTGLVTLRDQINEVLDLLLLVVTGLLGIAVVIALIGVGNTLALSVVERRQENGLLRALGLTRGSCAGCWPGRRCWSPAWRRCSASCSAARTA